MIANICCQIYSLQKYIRAPLRLLCIVTITVLYEILCSTRPLGYLPLTLN